MSSYTATIRMGPIGVAPTHTYVVTDADAAPTEADPVLVLDDLSAGWSFPENEPWPSQPDGQTFTLRLLVDDLSTLADLGVGDAAYLKVVSGGTLIWEWAGVIASMIARPVRRKAGRKILVTITVADPLQQLADVLVDLSRPDERVDFRWDAIVDAVTAAKAADPNLAPAINSVLHMGTTDPIYLPALDVQGARAYDLFIDIIRQAAGDDGGKRARYLVAMHSTDPAVQLGVWDVTAGKLVDKGVQSVPAGGLLALTAHRLGVTFPLDGVGIVMPADELDEDSVSFAALRYDAISRIRVTSADDTAAVVSNGVPGREYVVQGGAILRHASGGDPNYAYVLGRAYLPRASDVRWGADGFVWRPTDAELTALDQPMNPIGRTVAGVLGDRILIAAVAIANLPAVVNPGSDSTFYGGSFSALTMKLRRLPGYDGCVLTFEGKIARRVETRALPAAPGAYVTWNDIRTNFPTVTLKAPDLGPNPSAEVDTAGWASGLGTGVLTRDTTDHHGEGVASFKFVTANPNDGLYPPGLVATGPGDYELTYWIKGTPGNHAFGQLVASPGVQIGLSPTLVLDGSWQRITLSGTAAAGTTWLYPALYCVEVGTYWFDEIHVTNLADDIVDPTLSTYELLLARKM